MGLSFPRLSWGRLRSAPVDVTLSPSPSTHWPWDAPMLALKCIPQTHALCVQGISWGFDLGKWKVRSLTTSWDSISTFPWTQVGVLLTGNLLGCWTQWLCHPNDNIPARITAGVPSFSPTTPDTFIPERWSSESRSQLLLASENPELNQEACLWYSSLSRKYYRCHFVAPKLLTRQHSYLIRHSTAIHIYLYLNSCPLYYTAGHASAPTPLH